MNTEQQTINEVSNMQRVINCLALELHESIWNDVNAKWQELLKTIQSNTINEPIELIDEYLMWSIVKDAARELYYIHNDKTYPDTEVYVQDKILRSFEKDLHHVYPFVFDKIKNSLHKKSEPIKDEELIEKFYDVIFDEHGNPIVDDLVNKCVGIAKQYAASQVTNIK